MLGACARRGGLMLLAAVAVLSVTPSLHAQDYFEQKKRELALEAQKMAADVTGALQTSRQLESKSSTEAKSLLQKYLLVVNDSVVLDDNQRADLRGKLLARLKEVDATGREQSAASDKSSKTASDKADREERERLANAKLQGQQKSTYDLAKDRISSASKTSGAQSALNRTREKGFNDISLEVAKAASKNTEQRITAYFVAKSEQRTASKLSKEEKTLLKAMNSTLSVDFDKSSFKDVMNYLGDKTGINIFPDVGSLKDAGVEYDSPVTLKANKLTVRTILKKILGDLGLTYVIKEGTVQVITPDRVKDYMVTRAYPVQDLVAPFDMRWGQVANRVQMAQQANLLMQLIMNSVEPASWQGVSESGYGSISYDPQTMCLIIRQTAEMHYMLGGGLGQ